MRVELEPQAVDAFLAEMSLASGADSRLDRAIREVQNSFLDTTSIELRARRIVERLALALQGSLLVRYGHPAVADAFCASRLGGDWGAVLGTLPVGTAADKIVERASVPPV